MPLEIKNVHFLRAYGPQDTIPPIKGDTGTFLPEVAIMGRSNVGKSSLINHFFGQKTLAKISSVPGKTQTVNLFSVDNAVLFVDLPGYGFAKVPKELRAKWGPMMEGYLHEREPLTLVLILFDIRRVPSQEDINMMAWLKTFGKNVIIVLTKSDKIKKHEQKKMADLILSTLKVEYPHVIYSINEGDGKEILKALINERL